MRNLKCLLTFLFLPLNDPICRFPDLHSTPLNAPDWSQCLVEEACPLLRGRTESRALELRMTFTRSTGSPSCSCFPFRRFTSPSWHVLLPFQPMRASPPRVTVLLEIPPCSCRGSMPFVLCRAPPVHWQIPVGCVALGRIATSGMSVWFPFDLKVIAWIGR